MSKTYNLFISHSWNYSDNYDSLVSLLDNGSYFKYKNFSVPKNDPIHNASNDKELYDAIKRKVNSCHVVIILAGVYSSYSKWINKEIIIANKEFLVPKPIIAIEPYASERTSKIVKDNADRIVKWNSNSLIRAIRELG
ncbi:molecular chaperone Tir [Bacillus sp. AFS015802]|uniref:TIR domain-containing protein n=1 Tax=Bacillus sp. AFS015802 TaxID=2033486 RepID=UPI000BF40604|nr:TIR domain-containing protein [Bacillus sp. AFS015802]PFA68766.1 molecular chaperone Tir [Bacillus sp. AFS015802]